VDPLVCTRCGERVTAARTPSFLTAQAGLRNLESLLGMGPSVLSKAAVGAVFFVLFAAADALAYIDPSSGSLVLQALLSALLGSLFLMRTRLRAIVARIARVLRIRVGVEPGPEAGSGKRSE